MLTQVIADLLNVLSRQGDLFLDGRKLSSLGSILIIPLANLKEREGEGKVGFSHPFAPALALFTVAEEETSQEATTAFDGGGTG